MLLYQNLLYTDIFNKILRVYYQRIHKDRINFIGKTRIKGDAKNVEFIKCKKLVFFYINVSFR